MNRQSLADYSGEQSSGDDVFKYHYLPLYLLIVGLTLSYLAAYTPLLVALMLLLLSAVAYGTYAKDKSAAKRGNWRVPENTLHLIALLGGWPGAIIAQQRLRHKTQKVSFRLIFWLTLGLNVSALGWLHTQSGAKFLHLCFDKIERLVLAEVGSNVSQKLLISLLKHIDE